MELIAALFSFAVAIFCGVMMGLNYKNENYGLVGFNFVLVLINLIAGFNVLIN